MPAERTRTLGAVVFALLMVTSVAAVGGGVSSASTAPASPAADDTTADSGGSATPLLAGGQAQLSSADPAINGTLEYGDGALVDGWKVVADGDGGTGNATFTSNGDFSVVVAENETYDLFYQQANASATTEWPRDGRPDIFAVDEVAVGTTDESVGTVAFPNASLVNVTVVNRTGHAVPDASVHVTQSANGAEAHGTGFTDADGRAAWEGADQPGFELSGEVDIHVAGPPGYSNNFTGLTVTSNESITLTLHPVVNVSGTLDEADGTPAAHDALRWHGRDVDHGESNITTDQGAFSARLVENATYAVEYHQDNKTTSVDTAYPKDGTVDVATLGTDSFDSDTTGLAGTLPVGHNLTVTVVNESGVAIENATVLVAPHQDVGSDDATHAHVSATTNATGDLVHPESDGPGFEVNGTVHVFVEPPSGRQLDDNATTIEVTGERHLTVTLEPLVSVNGSVSYADGSAPAGYSVSLWDDDGDTEQVAADGNFTLHVGPDQTYRFGFEQTDWEDGMVDYPRDGNPDVHAFREVSVGGDNQSVGSNQLPPAHLLNVTVVTDTGDDLGGVPVTVAHRNNGAAAYIHGETDSLGRLVLEGASTTGVEANGTVDIYVEPEEAGLDYAPESREVELTGNDSITITVEPTVSYSGTHYEADVTPAAADQVHWHSKNGTQNRYNVTDSDGRFSSGLRQNTTYGIAYLQDDPRSTSDVAFPKDGSVDLLALGTVSTGDQDVIGSAGEVMPPGHNLTVTVVDESGSAVSNASVRVTSVDHEGVDAFAHVTAPTNDTGDLVHPESDGPGFEVNGTVFVDVEPPSGRDLQGNHTELDVQNETHVTIVLPPTVPVNGTLLYNDSTPASSTTVHVHGRNGTEQNLQNVTDADGRFEVGAQPNATYNLHYHQDDFTNDSDVAFPTDGRPDIYGFAHNDTGTAGIDAGTVTLPSAYQVHVQVVDERGDPVQDATVRVIHNAPFGAEGGPDANLLPHGAPTNANGLLEVPDSDGPGLDLVGDIFVYVIPPDGSGLLENGTAFTVTNDTNVTVVLRDAVDVSGTVRQYDGTAADGDRVKLHTISDAGEDPDVEALDDTDAGGNFTVQVAPNRTYNVQYRQQPAARDGYVDVYAIPQVDVGGSDLGLGTTTLPRAHVLNVTVVTEDGTPVSDADVTVNHGNGDAWSTANLVTDADGAMVDPDTGLAGIEINGSVHVHVEPPAGRDLGANNTFIDVHDDTHLRLVLPPLATVNGTLREADGSRATNDSVIAVEEGMRQPEGILAHDLTDGSGAFSLDVPANVTYTLSAAQINETANHLGERDGTADFYPVDLRSDANDTDLGNVSLPAGHVVNVTVVNETGAPVANASIDLLLVNETTGAQIAVLNHPTDSQGRLVAKAFDPLGLDRSDVPGLELTGNVTVEVRPPEDPRYLDRTYTRSLNVTGPRNVTVELNEVSDVSGRVLVADGDPAVDQFVWGYPAAEEDRATAPTVGDITNDTGAFVFTVPAVEYNVTYFQGYPTRNLTDRLNWVSSGNFPRDGSPDLYAWRTVNTSDDADLGDLQLPPAHVLDVVVVDESGDPVNYANVTVSHAHNGSGVGWVQLTHPDGHIYPNGSHPGMEVVGNVSVEVTPPSNATGYVDRTYTRELNVTSDRTVTVQLQEPSNVEYVPDNHSTIQQAVDAVKPNGTVVVDSGTYNESLTIDKPLTLVGDPGSAAPGPGPSAPVLDGGDVRNGSIVIAPGVSNVTVSGVVVQNYSNGGVAKAGNGTGVRLVHSRIDVPTGTAVVGYAPNDETTLGFTVQNNTVRATNGTLVVADGNRTTLNLTVAGNRYEDVSSYGLDVTADGRESDVRVAVVENYLNTSDDAIQDVDANGANSSVRVAITGNDLQSRSGNAIDDIWADAPDQQVAVTIENNRLTAATDGLDDINADGARTTVDVGIHDNIVDVGTDGVDNLVADAERQTVRVAVTGNDINASTSGVDDIDVEGPGVTVDVIVHDNTIFAVYDAISDIDASGDDASVALSVAGNRLNSTLRDGIGGIDASGVNTTLDVDIVDNDVFVDEDAIYSIYAYDDNQTVDVTIDRNSFRSAAGEGLSYIEILERSSTRLAITDNTFDTYSDSLGTLQVGTTDAVSETTIARNTIRSEVGEGINDLTATGTNGSADFLVTDNTIEAGGDGIEYLDAHYQNQTVSIAVKGNVINASDDAIYQIDASGYYGSATVTVAANDLQSTTGAGIDDLEVDGDDKQATVVVVDNRISADDEGIDDIDASGTNTSADVDVVNNTITSATSYGIDYIEAYDDNQTLDFDVVANDIDAYYEAIYQIDATGTGTTAEVDVVDNRLNSSSDSGIEDLWVADADDQQSNLTFVNNTVVSEDDAVDDIDAYGTNTTVRLVLADNTFTSVTGWGFDDIDADSRNQTVSLVVYRNTFSTAEAALEDIDAFGTDTVTDVDIVGNTFDAGTTAVEFDGSSSSTARVSVFVADNRISAGTYGVLYQAGGATGALGFANNTIEDAASGLRLEHTGGEDVAVHVVDNTIRNNTVGVNLTSSVAVGNASVYENSLAGNSQAALVNGNASAAVNATRNWWGARDGPSGAYGGSGAAVVGPAVIEPYYIDAAMTTLSSAIPVASPSDSAIAYHSVAVDETATKRFAVVNEGNLSLTINEVRVEGANAGAFTIEQGGGTTTLAPDEGVDVVVSFTPGSEGEKTARVVIDSDDPVNPTKNVSVSGVGRTTDINVSPTSVSFGQVARGSTRTANVTVTNDGFADLDLTGASITGSSAFTVVGGSTATVVPGQVHVVTVAFAPDSAGPASATLSLANNDPNQNPVNVTLDGVGTVPDITVTPTSRDFGDVPTDSSSSLTVTVTNDGNATLVMPGPSVGGADANDFAVVSPVTTTRLQPGESRDVMVSFAPSDAGNRTATLDIASNDPDEPSVSVALAGRGTESNISIDRSTLAFGDVRNGTTATATFNVTNAGTDTLDVTGISLAGPNASAFAITNGGTAPTLNPGDSHQVTVEFAPTSTGDRTARIEISSDDPQAPSVNVSAGGTGVEADINVSTTALGYADTRVAGATPLSVTVSNEGNANLTVDDASLGGADVGAFTIREGGNFTLLPGESRNVTVAFTPAAAGTKSGVLSLSNNDPDEDPVNVTLDGSAVTPLVTVTPEALQYGDVGLGTTTTLNVTLGNDKNATANLTVRKVIVIGPDASAFDVTDQTFTLAPGDSQVLDVDFTPTTKGDNKTATLRLITTDPGVPQVDVWLTNSETIVDVDRIEPPDEGEQGVRVDVTNATANETVNANVSQPESRESNVGVDELSVNTTTNASFSANVTTDDRPLANFTRSNVSTPMKFIRVNQTIDDADLSNVSFVVRVSKVQLAQLNVTPEDVTVYRRHNGTWNELNVTLVGETRTHFLYLVKSPGFSEFSASAKKPNFDIEDATLSVNAVRIGDSVRIITRITNAEDAADGTFTVRLLEDGSVVETTDVTIAAGGTRQVTFTRSYGQAGSFRVEVNSELAGTVSVQSSSGGTSGGDTSGGGGGGAAGGGGSVSSLLGLADVSLSTSTIEAGESIEVSGRVTNTGDAAGVFTARFTVNGVTVDTREVRVPANSSATVSFSRTFERGGSFDLAISGQPAGTLTVEGPEATPTPEGELGAAQFAVEPASLESTTVEAGQSVVVEATVANAGDATGEYTATLEVNDVTVARQSVTVPAGESVTVTFERTFEQSGRYEVAVSGQPVGALQVEPTPTPTRATTAAPPGTTVTTVTTPEPGLIEELPGFGPVVALVALLAFGLLAGRRRRDP